MKNIVIAAGYATRLGELTKNFPKPLLKIGSNTILGRMLDDIDTIPDIDEHIIITNHKFAPIFEDWVKANTNEDIKANTNEDIKTNTNEDIKTNTNLTNLTNNAVDKHSCNSCNSCSEENSNPCSEENSNSCSEGNSNSCSKYKKPITVVDDGTETNDTRLGAVCDLLFAMDKLSINDDLLVVAADNLLFFSFREFVKFAQQKQTSCIMCHEQPSIEKLQRTGVVELDANNRVLGMEEKPEHPKSHWAVPPFYIYLKQDLDLVRHSVENGCGKDAPGNLAHYMVEHTTMHAWPMSAGRFDIGSLDTYYEAVRLYGNEHEGSARRP